MHEYRNVIALAFVGALAMSLVAYDDVFAKPHRIEGQRSAVFHQAGVSPTSPGGVLAYESLRDCLFSDGSRAVTDCARSSMNFVQESKLPVAEKEAAQMIVTAMVPEILKTGIERSY